MNERVTVMIRDCNEKAALNMTTFNDSERGSKRKMFFSHSDSKPNSAVKALCSCY